MKTKKEQQTIFYMIIVFVILFYVYYYFTRFERTLTVNNNNLLKANGDFSENLLSDNHGNIYKVSNNLLVLFFTAAETLNKIESGKTYVVSGYGRRIPLLGLYPQIMTIKPTASKRKTRT